jgi:predicted permease
MSTLLQDIRFSIRTLSKSPGFTLVSVLTMALGIGALSSIFSVVNAVLLRSLPYESPERLVLVDGYSQKEESQHQPLSYLDLRDIALRQRSFESLAARTDTRSFIVRGDQGPELVDGEIVSSPYFTLLGVKPALGRLFLPEEDVPPGTHRVALLSNDYWHSHFGGDRSILGRVLTIDQMGCTVVGVLPAGFSGLTDQAKIWLPLSAASTLGKDYVEARDFRWLYAVGRLKNGVTLEQARKDLDGVGRQLEAENPKINRQMRDRLTPLAEAWFGDLRRNLLVLLGGVLLLLLIVCTNLANLLLARFVARRRDLSLRMALGARRGGLVRQILTESVILALLGCGAGLLLARWSTGLLVRISGIPLKSFVSVDIDFVVVAVVLAVSLFAGLLFGLVPALVLSSKLRIYEIFNEVGRRGMQGESHHRFQNMLIIGEVAVALLLLVCAGLMTKGFNRLTSTDLGFKDQSVLTMRMSTKVDAYAEDSAVWGLVTEAQQKVGSLPGVRSVAFEGPAIPGDDWEGHNVAGAYFSLEDRPAEESPSLAVLHFVSPGYFSTLGVPLAAGRDFQSTDTEGSQRVAVISEGMAQDLWPGQSVVGKRLKIGRRNNPSLPKPNPWLTVVGVVRDLRHGGLLPDGRPAHNVYVALLQQVPRRPSQLALLVHTSVAPLTVASSVRKEIRALAPNLPIYDEATLEERLERQTTGKRSFVVIMSLFACFALTLAAVGVYGVVSYSVANRTQEIGVRMALGAQLRDVLRLVVGQGGRLALMGVALGLLLALVVTPVLTGWLYGVSPLDKVILCGMSVLLLGVAMVASYIPARRAAKVAPFQALRLD